VFDVFDVFDDTVFGAGYVCDIDLMYFLTKHGTHAPDRNASEIYKNLSTKYSFQFKHDSPCEIVLQT